MFNLLIHSSLKGEVKLEIEADFVIINANELVTLKGSSEKPRIKDEMRNLGIIKNGAVAAKDGKIVAIGETSEVLAKLKKNF